MNEIDDNEAMAKAALLLLLRQKGIRNRNVMRAMEEVPRERFIEPAFRHLAWNDQALPIECGQSISQPSLVARMTEALEVEPEHRVLEIGTGSGYQAAILGSLANKVVTVERFHTLAREAQARLKALHLSHVDVVVADGSEGYLPGAPYDRVMISAAVAAVPPAVLRQLTPGGMVVAPIGPIDGPQVLTRLVATPDGIRQDNLGLVRFVPLLPGIAEIL